VKKSIIITAVAAGIIIIGGIGAGVITGINGAFDAKPASAAAATPTPSAAAVAAAPKVGDVVPYGTTPPEGLVIYPLPGKKMVLVAGDQPLPAAVNADIQTRINQVIAANPATASDPSTAAHNANDLGQAIATETGKQVLVVATSYGQGISDSAPVAGWSVLNHQAFDTKAQAVSWAQAYVAAQPDPSLWLIVVPQ
jgi:hypothetical protein